MMHFFRRSKIHLDCFTSRRDVIEYAPVVNGMEVIPDWWKKLSKENPATQELFPTATMKTCVGMYDYYNKSVAMPLWSDLYININSKDDYNWKFSDHFSEGTIHNRRQYAGVLSNVDFGHLKIESPWLFSTKSDIHWLLSNPIYNQSCFGNYVMAQGLLNFSRQHATSLQLFLDASTPRNFVMPFGSVFLFTPMTDKKVVIHRQLISETQYESKAAMARMITFINKYKNQQKITKCPYKDNIK
jgi:hypothetical protein